MAWILVDLLIALLAIVLLTLAALRLWRTLRGFGRQVSAASDRIAAGAQGLEAAQRQRTAHDA